MTSLLVSTTSQSEIDLAITCGADIIDLKNPSKGALGALPIALIAQLVSFVDGRKKISATIGDIPMEADSIKQSIEAFSDLGLDYIKIGFFETEDYVSCFTVMQSYVIQGCKLIAVLFAENDYPEELINQISAAGFAGVMYDTKEKNGRTLFDVFTIDQIENVKNTVQSLGMFFGLAGSLNIQHINSIKMITPDFAGFRGGVCKAKNRVNALDFAKLSEMRKVL